MSSVQVVVVAHGTIENLDDIPAFLQTIRGGRPASPAVIEQVRARYEAIGMQSPLLRIASQVCDKVQRHVRLPCHVAMRYWHPTIAETLTKIAHNDPVARVVLVSLAPYRTHSYVRAVLDVADAMRARGHFDIRVHAAPCIGQVPMYLLGWAHQARSILAQVRANSTAKYEVIATAHSLPVAAIGPHDQYEQLLADAISKLSQLLGDGSLPIALAYQSQPRLPSKAHSASPSEQALLSRWLEPTLVQSLEKAALRGVHDVVLVPVGFPIDHAETLYDLDIEAKADARHFGLQLHRVPCLNTSEYLVEAIVRVIEETVQSAAFEPVSNCRASR